MAEDIVSEIASSGGEAPVFRSFAEAGSNSNLKVLCGNNSAYFVRENANTSTTNRVVTKRFDINRVNCPGDAGAFNSTVSGSTATNSEEILGPNLSIYGFDFSSNSTLSFIVAYGDLDLLDVSYNSGLSQARCRPGLNAGSQFCATSGIQTTVYSRLK